MPPPAATWCSSQPCRSRAVYTRDALVCSHTVWARCERGRRPCQQPCGSGQGGCHYDGQVSAGEMVEREAERFLCSEDSRPGAVRVVNNSLMGVALGHRDALARAASKMATSASMTL